MVMVASSVSDVYVCSENFHMFINEVSNMFINTAYFTLRIATYFICLSCRVDENVVTKSILYFCKFCFKVSRHRA
jgi:hypothetical protein